MAAPKTDAGSTSGNVVPPPEPMSMAALKTDADSTPGNVVPPSGNNDITFHISQQQYQQNIIENVGDSVSEELSFEPPVSFSFLY